MMSVVSVNITADILFQGLDGGSTTANTSSKSKTTAPNTQKSKASTSLLPARGQLSVYVVRPPLERHSPGWNKVGTFLQNE